MEDLIAAIRRLDELDVAKQLVLQLPRETLEHQEEHYDPLHHAIEVNYPEVVRLFFLRGLYLEPHQPKNVPYLHLACWLGRVSLVHILLEFRPGDFKVKISVGCFIGKVQDVELESESSVKPVDVAASAGHISCVQALLGSQASKCNLGSLLERAVEVNSPGALQVLLSTDPSLKDKNKAFREALRRKLHQCVELLLQHGAQPDVALNRLNPYHVMYMYSSAYQVYGPQQRDKGLDDTTAVLLQNGCPPHSCEPFGSFPLYSLLHSLVQEKDHRQSCVPIRHISCLRHLLANRADPNFDELQYAKERDKKYFYNMAVGRDLFTSALNALFVSLQASDTWRSDSVTYLEECVALLFNHGADAGYVDCLGETPLHDLMKVIAMQHAMGHMQCNVRNICRMLLYHGGDPNIESSSGFFPVHQYFSLLCELMGGLISFRRWKAANNAEQVVHMLYFMDHKKAVRAYDQVLECMKQAKEDGMTDEVIGFVSDQMLEVVRKPKPLQDLCKLCIWHSVGRKRANLELLHMPKSFVRAVHGMFE